MKVENVIRITADEGKVITNGTSFGSRVVIEDAEAVKNFYEIPVEEYLANRATKGDVE